MMLFRDKSKYLFWDPDPKQNFKTKFARMEFGLPTTINPLTHGIGQNCPSKV